METTTVDRGRPVTIITGAYGGLGSALAIRLAKEGHNLVVSGRNKTELKDLTALLLRRAHGMHITVIPVAADIRKSVDCDRLVREAWNSFDRIDTLINAAGVFGSGREADEVDRIIDTNVKGSLYCSAYALEHMEKQTEGGMVVSIASTSGIRFKLKEPVYTASKFAVVAYSAVLYNHYKHGEKPNDKIKILCLAPGGMKTTLFRDEPKRRERGFMDPAKVAELLVRYMLGKKEGLVVLERNGDLNRSNFDLQWKLFSHKKLNPDELI